ncbi:MAG: type II toxin-antitoxin system HicA family toxin [Chitinophagaceae bacterium]|nr:type II toxin-antitoxin system HicA family toxin [Chitinophagaceae bacterium]MDP1810539.1 type II toxin-antitoxin system HicA family toxin [Sediminibacterium sp.]MDP3129609.1 type II toxin-antitoxin system HicA family toxin [Sediminibacterium sp.]
MSKKGKLASRLKAKPTDFTYAELRTFLSGIGYKEDSKGKTSGSRVSFFHGETKHIISLHKPHPGNILKRYQINIIVEELVKLELL